VFFSNFIELPFLEWRRLGWAWLRTARPSRCIPTQLKFYKIKLHTAITYGIHSPVESIEKTSNRELAKRFKAEISRTVATARVEVSLLSPDRTHVLCDYGTGIRL
jgi:hypothetical protein